MNLKEVESRLMALERAVGKLESRLQSQNGNAKVVSNESDPAKQRHWWEEDAGKYKDDPDFKMAMRLGRKYRRSLDPPKKKKKGNQKKLTGKHSDAHS
jgi:hypothetical protein